MKYVANPVIVDAYQIKDVKRSSINMIFFILDNGEEYYPLDEMMSRYTPIAGDYVVTQSDNYTYLNPKDVFERKYSLINQGVN
jgi:hypothetical protein